MEQKIKQRYSDSILQEAQRRYDISEDRIQDLGGFESYIYEFERDSRSYILRIGHSLRRSEVLVRSEVDWINYLAKEGVSVARAVPSENGRMVESIDDGDGGSFLACAFVKARGKPPWEVGWTPALYETYGQLLGRMHRLAWEYIPSAPDWQRPNWDFGIMEDAIEHLPASEENTVQKCREVLVYLHSLPKDRDSYGLIHYDAHSGNLFIDDDGTITLFDFDDCAHGWFMLDIAMVLFYIVIDQQDKGAFAREFMTHFLNGYRREFRLDPKWLQEIPHFLKLREIDLYAVIHRSFDVENMDDAWNLRYMKGRKTRIEQDVPYIDFDFRSLAGLL